MPPSRQTSLCAMHFCSRYTSPRARWKWLFTCSRWAQKREKRERRIILKTNTSNAHNYALWRMCCFLCCERMFASHRCNQLREGRTTGAKKQKGKPNGTSIFFLPRPCSPPSKTPCGCTQPWVIMNFQFHAVLGAML
jgi:hypothetical protein